MPTMAIGMESDPGGANPLICGVQFVWSLVCLFVWAFVGIVLRPLLRISVYVRGGKSLDSPFTGRADGAILSGRGRSRDVA